MPAACIRWRCSLESVGRWLLPAHALLACTAAHACFLPSAVKAALALIACQPHSRCHPSCVPQPAPRCRWSKRPLASWDALLPAARRRRTPSLAAARRSAAPAAGVPAGTACSIGRRVRLPRRPAPLVALLRWRFMAASPRPVPGMVLRPPFSLPIAALEPVVPLPAVLLGLRLSLGAAPGREMNCLCPTTLPASGAVFNPIPHFNVCLLAPLCAPLG